MAYNISGLRIGSVVKDKVMLEHEAKVVSIQGEQLVLESLNRRDVFHHSEHKQLNELYSSMGHSLPYVYVPDRPDFQFGRHYSEVELITY